MCWSANSVRTGVDCSGQFQPTRDYAPDKVIRVMLGQPFQHSIRKESKADQSDESVQFVEAS